MSIRRRGRRREIRLERPTARAWIAHLVPDDDSWTRRARWRLTVEMLVLVPLLRANDWLIRRFCPDLPVRWDPAEFPWIPQIEAAAEEIRAELDEYLRGGVPMPQVAELSGLDPDSRRAREEVPATRGSWRTLVLFVHGRWTENVCRSFPATRAAVSGVPALTNVAFSALEGRSHIGEHAAPNRGGVRYQLPVIVPGKEGDYRIRIVDETVAWREGESLVFDFAEPHEVWNDTDELRVLLMLEVRTRLPWPLALVNRFVQYLYRRHPSYQGMDRRAAEFEQRRQETLASSSGVG